MRIGIAGCGFIGRVHSWAFWALRKAELISFDVTAVCDADETRARDLAEPHGAEVLDYEGLLDATDVVYVCTPTSQHLELVEAAAERGHAIFCEKPLAPNLEQAARVTAALQRVPHQVGLVMRAAPVFNVLRDEIASGRHGRPMVMSMRDDQYFPIQGQYGSSWRAELDVAGGGTLIEHSIHDLDLFRFLLGAEPSEVSCRTAAFFGHEGIEDLAVATFAYPESGLVATLTSVWHEVMSRPSTRRLEVFCEQGHLWTEDDNCGPLHIETSSGAEARECLPPAWVDDLPVPEEGRRALGLYAEASRRFLAGVSTGSAGSPDAAEALAAHRLVDAAYRSASSGGAPVSI
jgi:predicted dehydrogenase